MGCGISIGLPYIFEFESFYCPSRKIFTELNLASVYLLSEARLLIGPQKIISNNKWLRLGFGCGLAKYLGMHFDGEKWFAIGTEASYLYFFKKHERIGLRFSANYSLSILGTKHYYQIPSFHIGITYALPKAKIKE